MVKSRHANVNIAQRIEETAKYPFDDVTKNPSDHSPIFYTLSDI